MEARTVRTIENVAIEALVEAPENPNEMTSAQMASQLWMEPQSWAISSRRFAPRPSRW